MARPYNSVAFLHWLDNYSREDLQVLLLQDFTAGKLSKDGILRKYRQKKLPPVLIKNAPPVSPVKLVDTETADTLKGKSSFSIIEHVAGPYTTEEAASLFRRLNEVTGTIKLSLDDLLEIGGKELELELLNKLFDHNNIVDFESLDIVIAGADPSNLYFKISYQADPSLPAGNSEDYL